MIRKRKKVRRMRGSRSHGYGVVKDHKGKGMSGGAGNAGRFSHNWISVIKEAKLNRKKFSGKYGFIRPQKYLKKSPTINVSHLNTSVERLVKQQLVTKDGDVFNVDLDKLGYKKLLSQGEVTHKLNITVQKATVKAVKKVEAAGGSVTLTAEQAE